MFKSHHISIEKRNRILSRKIRNEEMVKIVREMARIDGGQEKAVKDTHLDHIKMGTTVDKILAAFMYVRDCRKIGSLLDDSFYSDSIVTNIALMATAHHHSVTNWTQRVLLQIHLVADCQLCTSCYAKIVGDGNRPDIISECTVHPNHAYFFACNYICDYCFSNKLYKKL
ncbi:ORF100 [Plodia interpunctella granulovirus]|uniref:ORF100 n=1 Tax=Plodia interpunctella granulovirus TaxID=262175 RepID=A0A1L5JGQ5_9BBAC|nr:ORF100 [Plodia interpunctella granulovirus]APO13984.1 ORF100 [Plodia interpunctella granulovirus]